ncbi:hypothetical protein SBA3_2550016 [Candidatus Sulfopaludibacter sp. SbA3]|nr:hypothetical protein SBA3_2550016 [Candidatus Sulfopaludibacter sp. SbA3]
MIALEIEFNFRCHNCGHATKKALEILKVNYKTRDEAAASIPAAFAKYYQDGYPAIWSKRQDEVKTGGAEVLAIWNRNIFPEMNVTWGRYPMNIGHTDFPGCFRCHDGSHAAKNGLHHTGLRRLPLSAGHG